MSFTFDSIENWMLTRSDPDIQYKKHLASPKNRLIQAAANPDLAAAWYDKHPNQLYLPENLEHLRGQNLTLWEISNATGIDDLSKSSWKRSEYLTRANEFIDDPKRMPPGVKPYPMPLHCRTYAFKDIEDWILSTLPKGFPYVNKEAGLKYSEALFVLPEHILKPDADTVEYVPDFIGRSDLNNALALNPQGNTIFSRHELKDANGEYFKITTHQFRHLLNTLAQSKYLNQELIAFWSGRKSIPQNEWYNHVSQEAYIEAYNKISDQTPDIQVQGKLNDKAEALSKRNGISKREALSIEIGAIHITRYGACRHDYSLTPCPKDKDCIVCGEHAFTKGDERQLEEARFQLQMFESAVKAAKSCLEQGEPGAQRWLDLNAPKLERWHLAVEMLEDLNIPDGTLISLPEPPHQQTKVGLAIDSVITTNQNLENEELDDEDLEAENLLVELGMI